MKYLLFVPVLLIGFGANAKDEFLFFKDDKYQSVSIEIIEGHLFINCPAKECLALRFFNGKAVPRKPNSTPEAGHPAARYCWDAGAANRVLKTNNSSRDHVDFCLFKDGSMVDSWDLYLKHFPNKKLGE